MAAWAAFVPFTPTDALCAVTHLQCFTHKTEVGWDRIIPFLASGFSSVSYHLGGSLPMYVQLCMTWPVVNWDRGLRNHLKERTFALGFRYLSFIKSIFADLPNT